MRGESARPLGRSARRRAHRGAVALGGRRMRQVNVLELAVVFVLGIVLFSLAITLVNVQYRARTLFVEHERAVDIGRRLADDQADLLLRVRKASLPGSLADGA